MHAYFTLNNFCNQKCITCPTGSNCKDSFCIPIKVLKQKIDECKLRGVKSVVLSGGEPFAYPYLYECIRYLYKNKINITILSNGTLITNEMISKLKKFKDHTRIVIAVHSDIEEEHDKVTCTKGSFNSVMKNIEALDKNGFNLTFKIILNTISSAKIKEISCLLEYRMLNKFLIDVCSMDMCNISKENMSICLKGEEIKDILDDYSKWYMSKKMKKFNIQFTEFPICLMSKNSIKFLQLNNSNRNFAFIPRHSSNIIFNNKYDCYPCMEQCEKCLFQHLCPGIWTSNIDFFRKDCKAIGEKHE